MLVQPSVIELRQHTIYVNLAVRVRSLWESLVPLINSVETPKLNYTEIKSL